MARLSDCEPAGTAP